MPRKKQQTRYQSEKEIEDEIDKTKLKIHHLLQQAEILEKFSQVMGITRTSQLSSKHVLTLLEYREIAERNRK